MANNSNFEENITSLAGLAKVLAHPARLAILKELANRETCVCGEIVDVLPLAQATVSQHLKELKSLGLIKGTIEGAKSCYCIDWEKFNEMKNEFVQFFDGIQSQKKDNMCC